MTTAMMNHPTQRTRNNIRRIEPKTPSQLDALNDMSENLLYYGCWGTGKTYILAAKALLMARMFPNNRIALIRRKRKHLKDTLWKVFIEDILPPSWVVKKNDTDLYRKLRNGSEIHGLGLDSDNDITVLASHQYGFIGVEEAREIRENQFDEQISRCLRLPGIPIHQAMLVSNPDRPGHWLNVRFLVERWKGYKAIKGTMLTKLLPKSYLRRVEQLRGVFRKRYKDGLWVGAEGMVYPFDPAVNVIKRFPIPKEWERVVACDWGFDNPFSCHWWAISPRSFGIYPGGSWFLYREMYHTHLSPTVIAPRVKAYNDKDGINPRVICDHDPSMAAIFKDHKIKTVNAVKDRLPGQATVFDLFNDNKSFVFEDALDRVDDRLVEERKPWSTAQEYPGYVWLDGKDDMSHDDDHGMDTERYAKHTRLKGGKRRKWRMAS